MLHIGDIPLAVVPVDELPVADAAEQLKEELAAVGEQQQQEEQAVEASVVESVAAATAASGTTFTQQHQQQPPQQQQHMAPPMPAHYVAAAAVAAAAGQQAQGHAADPTSSMYMAGVAAGVAAATLVAQQQHAQQQQQQYYQPPWSPAQQQHPHPPQQQAMYFPPPPQYYPQAPYGYPMGSMGVMAAPPHMHTGYAPYVPQQFQQQQHYDPQQQQYIEYYHQQQQQPWGEEAAVGSSCASEVSYPHTYPSTPAPSTPSGARSISGASSSALSRRGGGAARGDTVTVSGASSVKDAAGAVAKVLERQGSCLLVALKRSGEGAACGATHVAAKTLAVSRFYVNARMGAAGAAGGAAARALVAAAEGRTADAAAAGAAAAAADCKEEVTFVPFHRGSGRPQDADSLGFVVFKVKADDLPMALPPPVGQPSTLTPPRDEQQQQHEGDQQQQPEEPPLLKAGAGTDVNKLSNAVIRNVLEWGRVSLQLAGPAACHVAMQALAKARARLARKFSVSIAVASAFSTEDTSGALGRSTVFYRLDVLRVTGAAAEAAAAGWSTAGLMGGDADGAASVAGDGASSFGGW